MSNKLSAYIIKEKTLVTLKDEISLE